MIKKALNKKYVTDIALKHNTNARSDDKPTIFFYNNGMVLASIEFDDADRAEDKFKFYCEKFELQEI